LGLKKRSSVLAEVERGPTVEEWDFEAKKKIITIIFIGYC
jgi:hypothetical protein